MTASHARAPTATTPPIIAVVWRTVSAYRETRRKACLNECLWIDLVQLFILYMNFYSDLILFWQFICPANKYSKTNLSLFACYSCVITIATNWIKFISREYCLCMVISFTSVCSELMISLIQIWDITYLIILLHKSMTTITEAGSRVGAK